MKITKTSSSITQNIMFTTIKELEDYIVITYPIGFNLIIQNNFIHIRGNKSKDKMSDDEKTWKYIDEEKNNEK